MTLDNFTSPNHSVRPSTVRLHPSYAERLRWIQRGVQSSVSGGVWDLPGAVPVAPIQPYDPGLRTSAHLTAQGEEYATPRGMLGHYVPLRPTTQRLRGDTADGILLYDVPGPRTNTVPIARFSRYHPFQRRS